jgi:hypothetical protein
MGGVSENPSKPLPPKKKKTGPAPRTDWQATFLTAYALHGIQSRAAKQAKVSVKTVDVERQRNEEFAVNYARAFEEACDNLESFAHRWATTGLDEVTENITYDAEGKIASRTVKTTANVSPTLLIFLLKAMRPKKYRDNLRIEQTGAGGGPIKVEIDGDRIDREVKRLLGDLDSGG